MSLLNTTGTYINGAGEYVGLVFQVDTHPEYYISPTEYYYGAEILIHDSNDFPDMAVVAALVQPGEELRLAVNPEAITSAFEVRHMDVQQRKCWFDNEIDLILAERYSFESCMVECKAAHAIELCHCLPYYFPLHSELKNYLLVWT